MNSHIYYSVTETRLRYKGNTPEKFASLSKCVSYRTEVAGSSNIFFSIKFWKQVLKQGTCYYFSLGVADIKKHASSMPFHSVSYSLCSSCLFIYLCIKY